MKKYIRPRRLSTIYNLEKPLEFEESANFDTRPIGFPWISKYLQPAEPEPLFTASRIAGPRFPAWPLMLFLVVLVLGIAFTVEVLGESVFYSYVSRIHS